MTTYQNTIEITDLSWNDTSSNFCRLGNLLINQVNQNQTITWDSGNGSGKVAYKTEQIENSIVLYDMSGTDISGYIGAFFSDGSNIGNNFPVGVGVFVDTLSSTDKQFNILYYKKWDNNSQSFSGTTTNFTYFPNDNDGGPTTITQPGFIGISQPIKVKSSLDSSKFSALRLRVNGITDISGTTYSQETIADISGLSTNSYYVNKEGLYIGLDLEPDLGDEDYVYAFFANVNCYHSNTIVDTINGPINIKLLKRGMKVNTKNGYKKIMKIFCDNTKINNFIVFEKNSLGNNIPNKTLMITKGHPLYYLGKYINSVDFIKNNYFEKIYLKKVKTEGLYHIQLETHECLLTNNVWTTSLPNNINNYPNKDEFFDKSLYKPYTLNKHYPPYCLHYDPPRDILSDDDLEYILNFN